MNTEWHQRRELEQAVMDGGSVSAQDALSLIADADQADTLQDTLDALEQALPEVGYSLIDVTTDDSEATELALVPLDA